MDVFDLFAKITLDSSEYEKALNRTKAESQAFVSGSFTKGFEKVAGTVVKIGTAIGGALSAAGGYAIKVGSDFEAGMSNVAAISGATGEDLERLSDLAKEMGATTKFSATEAAEGYQYMAMAGWKTEDMLNGLPGIMNLAAASGEDLGTVSDIVTDALTAMGLAADDSAHFADVLAAASSNSNTNVSMMGETFKYAAPLAGALGYNIEDLAQAIGLMANSGIKSTQAGTSLRSILTRLADPPKDCAAAMEQYGISMTNSDGTMKSLMEVMENMRDSLGGLSEQEQASAASAIGGQEAMSGLLAIVNASESDFDKLASAIDNADGAAQSMADTAQDNLQGKLTILKSALEGVGISAYEKFEEPLKKAVDVVTEAVSNFDLDAFLQKVSDVLEKLKDAAPVIATITGALTGLYGSLKTADKLKNFGEMMAAISKAGGLVASLGGPIAIVVAAIAALVAGFATLYATNENFRNGVNAAWDAISAKIQEVVAFVQPYVETAMQVIGQVIEQVVADVTPVIESIGNAFSAAWDLAQTVWAWASAFFQAIFQAIVVIFTPFAPIISGFFQGAWIIIQSIWNVAVSFFQTVFNLITGVFSTIDAVLSGDFQGAWESIQGIFEGVFDFFSTVGQNVVEGIKGGIAAVWDGLVSFVQGLWDGIKSIFVINAGDVKNNTGADGSHAGGMDYVPYNNYVANLHRGEMVLTADEADSYRRGKGSSNGFTLTQNIYAAKQTPVELAAATQAAFVRARWAL